MERDVLRHIKSNSRSYSRNISIALVAVMFKKRLVVPITGGQCLGLRTEETVVEGDASMATFFFGLEVVSPPLLRFSEPMLCCVALSMRISQLRRI